MRSDDPVHRRDPGLRWRERRRLAGGRAVLLTYAERETWQRDAFKYWLWRMKVYFAGNLADSGGDSDIYALGARNRLLTYADRETWQKGGFAHWVAGAPRQASVFLDSGAFAAYTRGAKIDVSAYRDYVLSVRDRLAVYANLDVIGDWRASARNLDVLRSAGLSPLPVFHRGSPYEELDRLAAESGHVALGGLVGGGGKRGSLTEENVRPHLDACFARLARRWPVKVHIFGVVAQWILERYPAYSADSATAITSAGMGRVMRFADGRICSADTATVARESMDGEILDGVSALSAKNGSAHRGRRIRNIRAQLALERYVTDLWASRGVTWPS